MHTQVLQRPEWLSDTQNIGRYLLCKSLVTQNVKWEEPEEILALCSFSEGDRGDFF